MVDALGHDHRGFRPNVYLGGVEGLAERGWAGSAPRIGTALIGVKARERTRGERDAAAEGMRSS